MLILIFSASIFVTGVSILHAVFVIGPSGLLEGLTANVEVSWFPSLSPRRLTNHSHPQGWCIPHRRKSRSSRHVHLSHCVEQRRNYDWVRLRISLWSTTRHEHGSQKNYSTGRYDT